MSARDLRTVKQLATALPGFTESAIRGLIFRANTNGLEPAIIKVGRRVLIDQARFEVWLESQRLAAKEKASKDGVGKGRKGA